MHRGAGFASRVTSSRYEQARETVATFVGAREDDQVVFTRNTTDSFNLLARALPEDTLVFVFGSEHHAALLPWPRALRLPVPHSHDEALDLLEQALRNHPAEHRLVVATGASNVTGEHWPVERLAALAHEHDARFALDLVKRMKAAARQARRRPAWVTPECHSAGRAPKRASTRSRNSTESAISGRSTSACRPCRIASATASK